MDFKANNALSNIGYSPHLTASKLNLRILSIEKWGTIVSKHDQCIHK